MTSLVPAYTSAATPWHTLSVGEVAHQLGVGVSTGLSPDEAALRLDRYGPNALPEAARRSTWRMILDQFKGLLILVLLGAAVLAGAVGDVKDAVVILVVMLVNALLGFYQEYRAEQSLVALKKMLPAEAEVRRQGKNRMIVAVELVPGDIVLLNAGDRVPADGRVLVAHGLEVDESSLTGESHAVGKLADAIAGGEVPLAERSNMLYMNTTVTRGRADMLVTATGTGTEIGRLATMLAQAEEARTPLQIQLDALGKRLAGIAGVVVALMLAHGLLRGEPWVSMVMTAISLAVAAIPEGLPAVVTVTLALGLHRMAGHRAIVKRLAAVETLGCTSVICTDKTGTLTVNQMTARVLYVGGQTLEVMGEGYDTSGRIVAQDATILPDLLPLLLPLALCNDAQVRAGKVVGDPMEGALKVLAVKGGLDAEAWGQRLPRVAEIPFDAAHKFMATFHHDGEKVRVFVKGAPDVLLARCSRILGAGADTELGASARARILGANESLAKQGLRVLAAASRTLAVEEFDPSQDLFFHIKDLGFAGLTGLVDPPRPEAKDAIAVCCHAGIQVKMLTGDQKVTAAAIAAELGLQGEVMTAAELDAMDNAALAGRIDAVAVFARVTPEQKVRLVRVLKARGEIVAMTGDGVNDAPALKSADIGVAMGITGTDVAKEAAVTVLTDDNFATIVRAVKEGRTIYDNIVKFMRSQLSTNMGAILTVVSAPFLGLPLPFNPIQILWLNIIMDGPPAMALGVDPARPGIMDDAPRDPQARILTWRRLGVLAFWGVIMAAGTLGMLWWGLRTGTGERALTLGFTTFILFQVFKVLNARIERGTAFNRTFFSNRVLWFSLVCVVLLQVLVVHWPPAQSVFSTTALSLQDWMIAAAVASSVLVFEEARKALTQMLGAATTTPLYGSR
jgi:Ca2+-transporting ATPase